MQSPDYVGAGSPAVSGESGISAGRYLAFAPLGPHIGEVDEHDLRIKAVH
jgi:hypothetical protein